MDRQGQNLEFEQKQKPVKSKHKESPNLKKSSSLAKLASKVTRKKSLKDKERSKDKQKRSSEVADDPVFSSSEDSSIHLDQPLSPTDSGGPSSPPMPLPTTIVPLSKSTSKSEDSLDSGIYSRQKSCDSVDSLESTGSSGNGTDSQSRPVMSYATAGGSVSPSDELGPSSMNTGQYADYWREYQDIRQSIIVQPDEDFEDKRSVARTDSGDDDDEGDWLRQAGLADLVTSAGLLPGTQSSPDQAGGSAARLSTDSLTSMTILSTLTRPQREAVLRRITSFNRAQKSKRRPKPHISAVFPQDGDKSPEGKPPIAPPSVEVTVEPRKMSEGEKTSKSTSLPHDISAYTDSYPRRYSEVTHRPAVSRMTETDGAFLSTSLITAYSTSSLEAGHVVKLDQKGYQRKEPVESIVATEPSAHPALDSAIPIPVSSQVINPSTHTHTPTPVPSNVRRVSFERSFSTPTEFSPPSLEPPHLSVTPEVSPLQSRSHFTFPPRKLSPKHDFQPMLAVPASSSVYALSSLSPTTISYSDRARSQGALPLRGDERCKVVLSDEFASVASSRSNDVEPFEFSPITLTTAMTAIRYTRVIRSNPTSPNVQCFNNYHKSNTLSVFSQPLTPISSVELFRPASAGPMTPPPPSSSSLLEEEPTFPSVSPKKMIKMASNPELPTAVQPAGQQGNVHSIPESDPPSPQHPRHQSSPESISFTSALSVSTEDFSSNHNLSSLSKTHRHSSMKNRSKSTNLSPRRKSIKSFQTSLQKVTALSLASLTTSPTRVGSYKLRRSAQERKLKRASSLSGKPNRPQSAAAESSASDAQEKRSSTGIETLSIHSRSPDENNSWHHDENFTEDSSSKNKAMSYSETADQKNLPNFSLVKDRLGITRISDLSHQDVRKVQSLALIELTALFDLHGIELKRRKYGKTKTKETGLFGVPLTTLLEWDQKRHSDANIRVPLVLKQIIGFLEKNGLTDEGILRVPGSAVRIKNLKQDLESRFSQASPTGLLDPNADWNEARTNDVAALLKQFLRELPNPLLTQEYIDAFQSCDLIPDRKQQLQALNLLIILLNEVHRDSLKLLLKYLSRVVSKEEVNKMTLNNVAMIMAPNLFMAKKQSKRGEPLTLTTASQDVKHAAGTSNIVRMLIKYHKLLWTVPTFMLTQVRNMNQAEQSSKKHHGQSKDKLKIKFLHGMTKSKDPQGKSSKSPSTAQEHFDYEVPKGVIRVKVENHSMTSMAVQLDAKSTAGDVIAKVQKQCERAKQMSPDSDITVITNETHALYEVGGNIYERCLDPGTNMHALAKINADATWVIKKRNNS